MPEKPLHETGVIHGRFQILHNDHLAYLLAGKSRCRYLVVGITNPDPGLTRTESADPERSKPLENPLTFYERSIMVHDVLLDAGLDGKSFAIVPFPINMPERYRYYVPMDATFFLTIYDDWGRRKQHYFESLHLKTDVLWEVPPSEKGISAGDIRQRLHDDEPWEHLVPACVPPLMKRWRVADRLRRLMAGQPQP